MKILRDFFPLFGLLVCCVCILACNRNSKDDSNSESGKIKKAGYVVCRVYSSDFAMQQFSEKGRLIMEFKYNSNGQVIEMTRFNLDGTVNHRIPVEPSDSAASGNQNLNFADQTVETVTMDSAGLAIQKTLITYNRAGNITDRIVIKNTGDTLNHNSYKYNEQGLIVEDIYWDIEIHEPVQVIKYEYLKP